MELSQTEQHHVAENKDVNYVTNKHKYKQMPAIITTQMTNVQNGVMQPCWRSKPIACPASRQSIHHTSTVTFCCSYAWLSVKYVALRLLLEWIENLICTTPNCMLQVKVIIQKLRLIAKFMTVISEFRKKENSQKCSPLNFNSGAWINGVRFIVCASKSIHLATDFVMAEHMELQQLMDIGSAPHYKSNIFNWLQSMAAKCPYLGILLATLSSLFFSLCSVIVKQLVDINPMELAMFRCVWMFVCLTGMKLKSLFFVSDSLVYYCRPFRYSFTSNSHLFRVQNGWFSSCVALSAPPDFCWVFTHFGTCRWPMRPSSSFRRPFL